MAATLVMLTACTTPDTVTPGVRDHSPTAVATPTHSAETDPAKLAIPLNSLPNFQAGTPGTDGWTSISMTGSEGEASWRIWNNDNQVLDKYTPDQTVAFGAPQTYTQVPGVLTFRGNNFRDAPAYGTAEVKEKKLEIVWTQEIGEAHGDGSYWPGAGWTGQPLLVNWPEATRKAMGFAAEFADKDLTEVIYPVFEGKIYRLDLETGKQTKPPIDVGCGFKGTGSIDPRGYPLLYAGQGLNDMDNNEDTDDCPFRYRIFDLIQNKEVSGWTGQDDPARPRKGWGAFDSSALVNAATDTLIEPAENGLVYKAKLNAKFDPVAKTVSVDPVLTKLEYKTPESVNLTLDGELREAGGIESSAAAYRNLMYATDNDGNLICWDATTMRIVWARDVGDDSDASIVIEDAPGGPFLYQGNSLDKRGKTGGPMVTNLRKINALTGDIVWEKDIPTVASYPNNGGLLATPALGQGDTADLVIFNVSKTTDPALCVFGKCLGDFGGELIALDRQTGEVVWSRHLERYSWSSPVIFQGKDGHSYGVFGDAGGLLHLFDPNTGQDYSTVSLGKNIEASAAVYNNMLVIASYDKKIFGVRIS
ncbi:MAG: PQQ-binding-like beta-propeller repeat protein [Propionibacteriaceae bacterium]|nr:PQQ-binding-like beta-propeller repeat protein [Propionibacteriaceae bacterium]